MTKFGNQVRQLRKEKAWTLTKLAAMLEMDSANLSKVETGKRSFDEKKLPLFCKIFSLNLEEMKIELLSEKFAEKVYSEQLNEFVFILAREKMESLIEKNRR